MNTVGQVERKTQQRVVKLFHDTLGYDYLGDWTDRVGNRNVEEDLLRVFLRDQQGYDEALITRALHLLDKSAGDTSKSLYDRNRDVFSLLRYAVKVKPGVGENTVDVWLIDWEHPENNHFAIAEEVTVAAADARAHASAAVASAASGSELRAARARHLELLNQRAPKGELLRQCHDRR